MINLPIGMISFLLYKMDYEFIANGLNPKGTFAGLDLDTFLQKTHEAFTHFKAHGDDRLTYVIGHIENCDNEIIGFESPNTKELFPFVFEVDGDMATNVYDAQKFIKDKYSRTNFSL